MGKNTSTTIPGPRAALAAILCTALGFFAAPVMSQDAAMQKAATERSGKAVVESVCVKCHGTGLKGAPRIGDGKAWSKRSAQGLTSLTEHALKGIRNMPAHGGNMSLTDLEIARAVTYMVNRSGGHWIEPVSHGDLVAERSGEAIVREQCYKCHETGKDGAPRIGDRDAWIPRMRQGPDYLVRSAIKGHGGMPSRGGLANATDGEIRSAILYMFNPGRAAVVAGPDRAVTSAAPAKP